MNQFASDKKYLELEGLKALIIKIGAMRAEYMGQNEEVHRILANLLARLDAIVAPDGEDANKLPVTDSYDYEDGTLFECVAKYIQDLRDELGATDAAGANPVYARLDQIEDWVKNGFTDEDGTVYAGLLDRVKKLEAESFATVECSDAEEVKANHKWEASFKNAKGEELAKIALDTKDFVIDGMLGDVKMISVIERGAKILDVETGIEYTAESEQPWATLVAESAVKNNEERYLVFSFKTEDSDGHVGGNDNNYADKQLQNIWVSVKDLHDNFKFKAEGADFITLDVATVHAAKGETDVVYSVKLTDDAVELINKGLGNVEGVRSYDDIDTDLHTAEDDIKTLQDQVVNGFNEKNGDNGNGLEADGGEHAKDGLLTRANKLEQRMDAAEGHIEDVEAWINEDGVISVDWVNDYFDYIVFGGGIAANPRNAAYEALVNAGKVDQVIEKDPAPEIDDKKYV